MVAAILNFLSISLSVEIRNNFDSEPIHRSICSYFLVKGPKNGLFFFCLFVFIFRDPEDLVLQQFRAGLGIMSTDFGTLYVFDRYLEDTWA